MKQFIAFVAAWFGMYLFFALICLLINWKTMDYADCLNSESVCVVSFFFVWIGRAFAASEVN